MEINCLLSKIQIEATFIKIHVERICNLFYKLFS